MQGYTYFSPKRRSWVQVRTGSARRFESVPTVYVMSKNKKNIKKILLKIFNFFNFRKICILHRHVSVMFSSSSKMFQTEAPCSEFGRHIVTAVEHDR